MSAVTAPAPRHDSTVAKTIRAMQVEGITPGTPAAEAWARLRGTDAEHWARCAAAHYTPKQLYTLTEIVTGFGLTADCVQAWISTGYLPVAGYHGDEPLYREDDVENAIAGPAGPFIA
jgi:hypothetical protein